jgi:cysteine-rich repeat protein
VWVISAFAMLGGCAGGNADSLSTSKLPVADAAADEDDDDADQESDEEADAGAEGDDADGGEGDGDEADAPIELLDGGEVVVVADPACGDGQLNPGEACDRGAANSDTAPDACRVNCQLARCGDGVVDGSEVCDQGARNSDDEPDACREDCTRPRCGDGTLDDGEECDTGAERSDSEPGACRMDCRDARCGDGVSDPDEACDDRNSNEQDGCLNNCRSASCGDNVQGPDEECDDGNTADGDGCQSTCRRPICGDRVVDSGEQCDDGNGSSNDGCRADCRTGCVAARECDDGTFCNGAERCVDGVCQAGPAVVLEDSVSCTVDTCDESRNTATHRPDDGLCSVQPTSCSDGVRISHTASCAADRGCQGDTSRAACPDARSTCTPQRDGSIQLATFTPACNTGGSDCGTPARESTTCEVPPPRCDSGARVGTVFAATCDDAMESCGSRVAETNDCTRLDGVTCGRGNLFAEHTTGQCDARGQCAPSTRQDDCDRGADSCSDGRVFTSAPTCSAGTGCGRPASTAGGLCPVTASSCGLSGNQQVFTSYRPACADGSSCLSGGTRVDDVCEAGAPTCSMSGAPGVAVYHHGDCALPGGCTFRDETRNCRQPDVRECSGNALQVRQARCKDGLGCTMDVEATQNCGVPTCGPAGAAPSVCGGCGTVNGAPGCRTSCEPCASGQTCTVVGGVSACRARLVVGPIVDPGIVVGPISPVTPVLPLSDAGIIAVNPGILAGP